MRLVLVIAVWLLGASAAHAAGFALVIGNGAYGKAAPLASASADASAVAAALKDSGLTVTEVHDADGPALRAAITALRVQAKAGEPVVVYFAGHAVPAPAANRAEGLDNYLLGIDAAVGSPEAATASGVSLASVFSALNAAKAAQQVVILDAGYAAGIAGAPTGLAEPTGAALRTAFVAYAAAPGVAPEPGRFASALTAALAKPGLSVSELFLEVSAAVQAASSGRQTPYASGSGGSARLVLRPAADRDNEMAIFAAAVACGTSQCLNAAAGKMSDLKLKADLQRRAALVEVDTFDPGAVGGEAGFTAGPRAGPSVLPEAVRTLIAANEGTAEGQVAIGLAFLKGESGFPQSDIDAFRYIMQAHIRGHPMASYLAGWFWHHGRKPVEGVDYAAARELFEEAAAKGQPDAMYTLSGYYEQGLGGAPKDAVKARAWLEKAAAAGQPEAKARLAGS